MAEGRVAAMSPAQSKLEVLYDAHVRDATRLAYLMTGDVYLAEDLAQDAFVRISGRFMDLRNADAFGAYLRRTVINLSKGHFRRRKVERAYLDRERTRAARSSESLPDIEGREAILVALAELPNRQRAAVVLRYFEDLSEQQTADVLHCSVGAVKSLVNRAMGSLRGSLAKEGGER